MSLNRDDFSRTVKAILEKRVGSRCSICGKCTSGPQTDPNGAINIGVASHITAAAPGGPRYDKNIDPKERKSIENGIWLCVECSVIIDKDESGFTIDQLKEFKITAERKARARIGRTSTGRSSVQHVERKIVGVPSLPYEYLERPYYTEAIKKKLLSERTKTISITGKTHRLGLQGMGGVGKSVIAAALAHDKEIQARFPDGIAWISIGHEPNPVARQSELLRLFYEPHAIDKIRVENYKSELIKKFNDKKCLIILDDVWHSKDMAPFDVLGESPKSCMIITTRINSVAANTDRISIDVLAQEEARKCFAKYVGIESEHLPDIGDKIIEQCGGLPVALAAVGSLIGKKNRGENNQIDSGLFESILKKLTEANIGKIKIDFEQYPDCETLLRVIQVGVEDMERAWQCLYLDFAAFPEECLIPEDALFTLWEFQGYDQYDTRDILAEMEDRSLIIYENLSGKNHYKLHDIYYDYVKNQSVRMEMKVEDMSARELS